MNDLTDRLERELIAARIAHRMMLKECAELAQKVTALEQRLAPLQRLDDAATGMSPRMRQALDEIVAICEEAADEGDWSGYEDVMKYLTAERDRVAAEPDDEEKS